MTTFPSITGKDLLLALKRAGFAPVRVKGAGSDMEEEFHGDGSAYLFYLGW